MSKKQPKDEVVLTNAQLRKITETASLVAIDSYRKEAEKARQENKDRRLYNTRLLMEKYRGLVKYAEDAVYEVSQIDEDMELQSLIELMENRGDYTALSVECIQERVARTKVVLHHINKMLEFYCFRCESSGKQEIKRKWETIKFLYLDEKEKTVQELAEKFFVDERTVYRYNRTALQDLSALFFGSID